MSDVKGRVSQDRAQVVISLRELTLRYERRQEVYFVGRVLDIVLDDDGVIGEVCP